MSRWRCLNIPYLSHRRAYVCHSQQPPQAVLYSASSLPLLTMPDGRAQRIREYFSRAQGLANEMAGQPTRAPACPQLSK